MQACATLPVADILGSVGDGCL